VSLSPQQPQLICCISTPPPLPPNHGSSLGVLKPGGFQGMGQLDSTCVHSSPTAHSDTNPTTLPRTPPGVVPGIEID
jgi:hypothetical protein